MLFSSIPFLLYFLPCAVVVYYALSFSRGLQNLVLLAFSLLFYAWGEPRLVLLMLGSIGFNWLMGLLIYKCDIHKIRKALLMFAAAVNLGSLFYYKYLDYFCTLAGIPRAAEIVLPIGISFYTFQALSYVIDVYNRKVKADSLFHVGLYISFFPQLVAGPILQYCTVQQQIRDRKSTIQKFSLGICRFTTGFGKKILLANIFAAMADHIFDWSSIGSERMIVPAMLAWLGCISYTLQIYFDFSAYSDMAIGLGLIFGFTFPENFNYPYIAQSVVDFWRRWHISLTSYFREYVYFPLGGSRVANQDIMVKNLFIVWLLTGIWHGANLTFLIWGLYYFIFQLAERFFRYPEKMSRPLRHIYTLLVVSLGWVIFRANDLYQAGRYFLNLFCLNHNGFYSDTALLLIRENWVFLLLGFLFSTPIARATNERLYNRPEGVENRILTLLYPFALLGILAVSLSYLTIGSYNPFIYFNF